MKIFDNPELLKQSIQSASNPPSLASNAKNNKIVGFLFKEKSNPSQSNEIHKELINEDHSSKLFRSNEFVVEPNWDVIEKKQKIPEISRFNEKKDDINTENNLENSLSESENLDKNNKIEKNTINLYEKDNFDNNNNNQTDNVKNDEIPKENSFLELNERMSQASKFISI